MGNLKVLRQKDHFDYVESCRLLGYIPVGNSNPYLHGSSFGLNG